MKVEELIERLMSSGPGYDRIRDWDVVIPRKQLSTSIGGRPSIGIKAVHPGFDWDSGSVFLYPEVDVRATGPAFLREQMMTRELSDILGWVHLVLRHRDLDAAQKLRAIQSHLNRLRVKGKRERDVSRAGE